MLASVNPASLNVSWGLPPAIDHNGPISGYLIEYTRVGSDDMRNITFNHVDVTTNRQGNLVPFVNYSVRAAAVNVNGTGPFSNPMVGRSGEDGEFNTYHIPSNRAPCPLLFSQNLRQLRHLNK